MDDHFLKKYLGMAVYRVYYHHERLYGNEVFPENYCDKLKRSAYTTAYWNNVRLALGHALQQEDYCLPMLNSPMKDMYPEEDIRFFFEKFHEFLKECYSDRKSG